MKKCKEHRTGIHKYRRINIGVNKVYFVFRCENCPHYLPENQIKGRDTLCWNCEKPTKVTRLYNTRSYCDTCTAKNRVKFSPDGGEAFVSEVEPADDRAERFQQLSDMLSEIRRLKG